MSNGHILARWRERWSRNLDRYLRSRVRAPVDVEDLAQETYLRLLRAPDLGTVLNPEAYLIRVASHVVAEWRRSHGAQESLDPSELEALADLGTPEAEISARMSQRRLNEALERLPALTRAVVLMRLRDGIACREIATAIGITDRQVKRHLARGYDRLRDALEL